MSAEPTLAAPNVTVTAEAVELARRRGVEVVLRRMIEVTGAMFPGAPLRVFAEPDVAIEDHNFLSFEVHLPHAKAGELHDAYGRWVEEMRLNLPSPRTQTFTLLFAVDAD